MKRLLEGSKNRAVVSVRVCTDAAIPAVAKEAAACVVGCDCVSTDGFFVNKMGTFSLLLAAEHHRIPLYILSDSFKISAHKVAFRGEEGSAEAIVGAHKLA